MHSGFDHVTIAVTELEEAKRFFGLLGFVETAATVVSGELMSRYMGIPDWEADHVTRPSRRSDASGSAAPPVPSADLGR